MGSEWVAGDLFWFSPRYIARERVTDTKRKERKHNAGGLFNFLVCRANRLNWQW